MEDRGEAPLYLSITWKGRLFFISCMMMMLYDNNGERAFGCKGRAWGQVWLHSMGGNGS